MIFYHGTAALNLAAIKAKGLIPQAGRGADAWAAKYGMMTGHGDLGQPVKTPARDASVYLTRDLTIARWFANMTAQVNGSKPAVLKIDLPTGLIKNLRRDEEGSRDSADFAVRFEGAIPPEIISIVTAKEPAKVPNLRTEP